MLTSVGSLDTLSAGSCSEKLTTVLILMYRKESVLILMYRKESAISVIETCNMIFI